MKTLLKLVGGMAVCLGLIGLFLPLLPTTPFLLLASACFLRSSPELHQRLMANKMFGPYLQAYQEGKGIPLRVKLTALSILWLSIAFALIRFELLWLQLTLVIIACAVTFHLYSLKTLRRS